MMQIDGTMTHSEDTQHTCLIDEKSSRLLTSTRATPRTETAASDTRQLTQSSRLMFGLVSLITLQIIHILSYGNNLQFSLRVPSPPYQRILTYHVRNISLTD